MREERAQHFPGSPWLLCVLFIFMFIPEQGLTHGVDDATPACRIADSEACFSGSLVQTPNSFVWQQRDCSSENVFNVLCLKLVNRSFAGKISAIKFLQDRKWLMSPQLYDSGSDEPPATVFSCA